MYELASNKINCPDGNLAKRNPPSYKSEEIITSRFEGKLRELADLSTRVSFNCGFTYSSLLEYPVNCKSL